MIWLLNGASLCFANWRGEPLVDKLFYNWLSYDYPHSVGQNAISWTTRIMPVWRPCAVVDVQRVWMALSGLFSAVMIVICHHHLICCALFIIGLCIHLNISHCIPVTHCRSADQLPARSIYGHNNISHLKTAANSFALVAYSPVFFLLHWQP